MNKSKRMILRGTHPCILTLTAEGAAVEWLKTPSEEPLYLFVSPTQLQRSDSVPLVFPPEAAVAAAVGSSLATRGQLAAFDWAKAADSLRIFECSYIRPPIDKGIFDVPKAAAPPPPQAEEAPRSAQDPCPIRPKSPQKVLPFPREYPESEWLRHDYPSPGGSWHYLTGTIFHEGVPISTATAVPGKYGLHPPAWLKGFSAYLTDSHSGQGYWIAVSPYSTKTED